MLEPPLQGRTVTELRLMGARPTNEGSEEALNLTHSGPRANPHHSAAVDCRPYVQDD